jgi:hypothetical protein
VPLLVGFGTITYGFWSLYEQSKIQFITEAAKAVMQSRGSEQAATKVKLLKALFPKNLPPNFGEERDPSNFVATWQIKDAFFITIASKELNAAQAVDLYRDLFSGDAWARSREIDRIIVESTNNRR